ncbi:SGNH/GDSL hydrolase family protein [Roseimarinus sediminis]|uniref:SGNH/GDSL hydrolase family protein n=1 Tax=Roseimarinus sediminis TaxID=1610899 RepID=UPI003D1988D2
MKRFLYLITLFLISLSISSCSGEKLKKYQASNSSISYSGHIDRLENEVVLIGSASSATAWFTGDSCVVYLRNYHPNGQHNYYSIELDGEDLGRFRIEGEQMQAIPVSVVFQRELHQISIYKSTEAANGYINFGGIACKKLEKAEAGQKKLIEFIGNSISCGMGNDTTLLPCHADVWYDQHNAYWAYGPTVSRALGVDFLLSSVSGIGVYRNWNSDGPVMPQVYNNLYLNTDESKKRNFDLHQPDIVSICLGTNDLSKGDGSKERLPFDEQQFTESYIDFVDGIIEHYPETQIALLCSPMIDGAEHEILLSCLEKVKAHFDPLLKSPVEIFQFENIVPHGCDYHPDINDHIMMADQLYPFYRKLLKL